MQVRLRPGTTIDDAISLIGTMGSNIYAEASSPMASHPVDARDAYVRWAVQAENQLLTVLSRDEVNRIFENPRHRDVCSMPGGNQLRELINREIQAKANELQEMAAQLTRARDRMRRAPGCPTIIDTNLFLECQRSDSIKWPAVTGDESVRLIVPLRVLEELEARKYDTKDRRREVARELLPWLAGLFPDGDCGPVPLRQDTTIEVLLAERPRNRPSDADEEVLDVCHEVRLLAGRAKLVTMDAPMALRARAESVDVFVVDRETYGRKWADS